MARKSMRKQKIKFQFPVSTALTSRWHNIDVVHKKAQNRRLNRNVNFRLITNEGQNHD